MRKGNHSWRVKLEGLRVKTCTETRARHYLWLEVRRARRRKMKKYVESSVLCYAAGKSRLQIFHVAF